MTVTVSHLPSFHFCFSFKVIVSAVDNDDTEIEFYEAVRLASNFLQSQR